MHSEYQSNAMTEIALALAMAFFSIMVLAMLSMGSAMQAQNARAPGLEEGIRLASSAAAGTEAASVRAVAVNLVSPSRRDRPNFRWLWLVSGGSGPRAG